MNINAPYFISIILKFVVLFNDVSLVRYDVLRCAQYDVNSLRSFMM